MLRALQPFPGIAALFGGAMLALWLFISNGVTFAIVPPPETEAESLVRALKARRYVAVRGELTEAAKEGVNDEQLKGLVEEVQSAHQGISDAQGETARIEGESAIATVVVKLEDKTEQRIELPLEREHGLWRVSSLEPLGRLTR